MLSFPSFTNDPRRESLLLRHGDHPVELPLGRGALGPHGRELLLQDALGGLELHRHLPGRGAELFSCTTPSACPGAPRSPRTAPRRLAARRRPPPQRCLVATAQGFSSAACPLPRTKTRVPEHLPPLPFREHNSISSPCRNIPVSSFSNGSLRKTCL